MRLLLSIVAVMVATMAVEAAEPAIPSLYGDDRTFVASIDAAESLGIPARKLSGLTVPHHLVAADLIARAFLVARDNRYDRIVVLTPDHFKRAHRPFATTRLPFDTVFGRVPTDVAAVDALLAHETLVEDSDLFVREHGIGALLPYVAHFFP